MTLRTHRHAAGVAQRCGLRAGDPARLAPSALGVGGALTLLGRDSRVVQHGRHVTTLAAVGHAWGTRIL